MELRVDGKSVLLGLGLGVVVMMGLGAGVKLEPQVKRYAIGANQTHVYVLDTVTGQVWEKFTPLTTGDTSKDFASPKLEEGK